MIQEQIWWQGCGQYKPRRGLCTARRAAKTGNKIAVKSIANVKDRNFITVN
jgi:hypothetical protein